MDSMSDANSIEPYKAFWSTIVGHIGAAVNGDPHKIKELQETGPLSFLQQQSDAFNHRAVASTSTIKAGCGTKRRRNRHPCQECKKSRQKVWPAVFFDDSRNDVLHPEVHLAISSS